MKGSKGTLQGTSSQVRLYSVAMAPICPFPGYIPSINGDHNSDLTKGRGSQPREQLWTCFRFHHTDGIHIFQSSTEGQCSGVMAASPHEHPTLPDLDLKDPKGMNPIGIKRGKI